MKVIHYDFLFIMAFISNLILVAALWLCQTRPQYTPRFLAIILLLYIPFEFGSLFLIIEKRHRILAQKKLLQTVYYHQLYHGQIQEEIRRKQQELFQAHLQLEKQLASFKTGASQISYETTSAPAYCSCLLLNAFFTHKLEQARAMNISFQLDAQSLPEDLGHEEVLISLLSNLLDNAIQAAVDTPDPWITCEIALHHNLLFIDLKNAVRPDLPINLRTSSKSRPWQHGFGMRIIRDILLRHDGQLLYEQQGDTFAQSIVLSLQEYPASQSELKQNPIRKGNLL